MTGPLGARDPPPARGELTGRDLRGRHPCRSCPASLLQAHDHLLQPTGLHPPIHRWAPAQGRHHRRRGSIGLRLQAWHGYDARRRAGGGESGQVHAVDVHELADPSHRRRINRFGLKNAAPVLTVYHRFADLACAIGRVFANADPEAFLGEPRRSTRKGDVLAIDNGRQSRVTTKRQLAQGGRGAGHRPAPR